MRSGFQRTFSLLCVALAAAAGLRGQAVPETMPARGVVPTGSYALSDVETIDTSSGNLLFRIPVTSLPKGPAGWSASVNLIYNSAIFDYSLASGTTPNSPSKVVLEQYLNPSDSGGWNYGFTYGINLDERPIPNGGSCGDATEWWKRYRISVISPDGSHHTLRLYADSSPGKPLL